MESSMHKISALYPTKSEAQGVRQHLLGAGIADGDIFLHSEHAAQAAEEGSDEVLKQVLVDGAIGTAVGTGVGVLGTVALVAANVTLFVASPLIAPLAMLGWFASLGGVVGAVAGAGSKQGKFSDLLRDAIQVGNTVLVVRTRDEAQRELVKGLVTASLQGRDMVATESD